MSETESSFALAPDLIANVLTIVFVYSFVKIGQKERSGIEEGRGAWLWLIGHGFLLQLYGLYTGAFSRLRN